VSIRKRGGFSTLELGIVIYTYTLHVTAYMRLGFLGGHWTESIIMVQPIVFFSPVFFIIIIIIIILFSPVDVTTQRGCGGGTRGNSL